MLDDLIPGYLVKWLGFIVEPYSGHSLREAGHPLWEAEKNLVLLVFSSVNLTGRLS